MAATLTRRSLALSGAAGAILLATRARAEVSRGSKLLMAGTRWETRCHRIDSGRAGPTIMIVAGMHGNENAPPLAARKLLELSPSHGKLIIIPEVNRPALAKRTRLTPNETHADLNRNFPTATRQTPRGDMAKALWTETVAGTPDWVLDLHEGWGYRASSNSMGSTIVRVSDKRTDEQTLPMAKLLIDTINPTIDSPRKKFRIIGPGRVGSYARAVVERLHKPALVFETTWTQKRNLRVQQQLRLVHAVLSKLGIVDIL